MKVHQSSGPPVTDDAKSMAGMEKSIAVQQEVTRGQDATRLALVLVFLAVAGVVGAIVLPEAVPGVGAAILPFAFSATVAAIGIWRQRRWAATAIAVWAGIAVLCGFLMGVLIHPRPLSEAGFVVVLCGGFWLVYRYVRRQPAVDRPD